MSISDIIIKALGVILAVVGLALILTVVGVNILGVSTGLSPILSLIVGGLLLGTGIYIVRGGTITA